MVVASPSRGVDALSGRGLEDALAGAQVLVNAVNLPRRTPYREAFAFFDTTTRNLLTAAGRAGVEHHVLLSIVGADRVNSPYFRGKEVQEQLVRARGVPYTIVRSTTYLEALRASLVSAPESAAVHVPDIRVQPVAGADLARIMAHSVAADPQGGIVQVAGPEVMSFPRLATEFLRATGDMRRVVPDTGAEYLGTTFGPGEATLVPDLRVGATTLQQWLVTAAAYAARGA
ncbi:SDR family oxidoreductase [Nocardioides humi]|uniref:SDR family oxidoreductase n=1 Tax=Nocardioides humi TaxID=449461 RepID=A0ABN2BR32_9ACTN